MEKYKSGDILKVIVSNYPNNEEWLVITNCYTIDTTVSKSTYETLVREKLEAHVGIKLNSSSNPTIILDWYIESGFSFKDLNITFATQEEKNTLLTVLEQNKLQYIDETNTLIGNLDNCKQIIEFNNTIDYFELPNINIGDFIVRNYSKTIYKVINITTRGISVIYNDNKNNLLNLFIPIPQLTNFKYIDFDKIDSFSSLNKSKDKFIITVNEYKKYLTI
jgi:hypothetical protein